MLRIYLADWKDDWFASVVIGILGIIVLLFGIKTGGVFQQVYQYNQVFSNLPTKNMMYFQADYTNNPMAQKLPDAPVLTELLTTKQAFSYLSGFQTDQGVPVFVGLGHLADMFQLPPAEQPVTVYAGDEVVGETFLVEPFGSLEVDQRLSNRFILTATALQPLDDMVLITMDYPSFLEWTSQLPESMRLFYLSQIYANVKLIDPSQVVMQQLLTESQAIGNLELTAKSLADSQRQIQASLRHSSYTNAGFSLICAVFLIGALFLHVMNLIEVRYRNYAIHQLVGSSSREIWQRMLVSVCLLTLPILIAWLYHNSGRIIPKPFWLGLVSYFVACQVMAFLVYWPYRRLNPMNHLRSNG